MYNSFRQVSPGSATRSGLDSYTPTVDYQRPQRTFNDFDPDEYLKDLKLPSQSSRPTSTSENISPSSSRYPYTSPNAKGLAPPPTDQPIRNPAKVGIEADVDALTIRMVRNMETGYGAAGDRK